MVMDETREGDKTMKTDKMKMMMKTKQGTRLWSE